MQKSRKILRGRKDTLAPVVSTLQGPAPPSPPPFRPLCLRVLDRSFQWVGRSTEWYRPWPTRHKPKTATADKTRLRNDLQCVTLRICRKDARHMMGKRHRTHSLTPVKIF